MPLLSVRNLRAYFRVRQGWVKAVDGVSLDVDQGETVGLVGESGCGKTTLAYAITQLLPSNAHIFGGQILFNLNGATTRYREEYWKLAEQRMAKDIETALGDLDRIRSGGGGGEGAEADLRQTLEEKVKLLRHPLSSTYRQYLEAEIRSLEAKVNELKARAQSAARSPQREFWEARERLAAATQEGDLVDITRLPDGRLREYHPKLIAIRWKQISIVFQGAMNALNPVYSVGNQIIEAIRAHQDITPEAARTRVEELYHLVGIPLDRIDNYPHEYSGGMKQRAMIAMALALDPKLVIMDEPTTALDVITAARIMDEVLRIQRELHTTLVIISHDVSVVAKVAERIAVMYAGKIVEEGHSKEIFNHTLHPYTQGLLAAFPSVTGAKHRLESIPGSPPSLVNPPSGCRFHPRCKYAQEICKTTEPEDIMPEPGHRALCHFSQDFHIKGGLARS